MNVLKGLTFAAAPRASGLTPQDDGGHSIRRRWVTLGTLLAVLVALCVLYVRKRRSCFNGAAHHQLPVPMCG